MADETKETKEKEEQETEKAEETTPEEKTESAEKKEEAPSSDASEDTSSETNDVEVPEKFKKIVEEIEGMSVLELNELVKVFEAKFGVSATAVAAGPAASGGGEDGGEEKTSFNVELTSIGDQKIQVIKAVKEILGLGLKDAKDMVESAPAVIKEGVAKQEAEEIKTKIEEAGGKIELK